MYLPFGEGLEAAEIADAPDLLNRASLAYQLMHLLRSGQQTTPALAETVEKTEGAVRKELHRLRKRGKCHA